MPQTPQSRRRPLSRGHRKQSTRGWPRTNSLLRWQTSQVRTVFGQYGKACCTNADGWLVPAATPSKVPCWRATRSRLRGLCSNWWPRVYSSSRRQWMTCSACMRRILLHQRWLPFGTFSGRICCSCCWPCCWIPVRGQIRARLKIRRIWLLWATVYFASNP